MDQPNFLGDDDTLAERDRAGVCCGCTRTRQRAVTNHIAEPFKGVLGPSLGNALTCRNT
jgi:hypothetical protein